MIIEEIRAVLAAKARALVRRSADDMAALMHPDFVHVTAGGRTLTRADYIDVFINSDRVVYHSQDVRELEVHLFDAVSGDELDRSHGQNAASVKACATPGGPRSVRVEARATAGKLDAVFGERVLSD